MNPVSNDIGILKTNVEELIAYCDRLREENNRLKEEKEEWSVSVVEKDKKIEELKETIKVLHSARSVVGLTDGSKDARKRIDELVGEIDKCIGMLDR